MLAVRQKAEDDARVKLLHKRLLNIQSGANAFQLIPLYLLFSICLLAEVVFMQ